MSASITTMKEPDGDILYPKTKTEAVYDNNNNRLDQTLASIDSQITTQEITSATTIASLAANVPADTVKRYRASQKNLFSDFPTTSATYYPVITIFKGISTRANIEIMVVDGNYKPFFITGYYYNGSLYWDSVTDNLTNILNPSYSTTGISYSDCTYMDGGYAKIGKLVIFNIRVTIGTASSTTKRYMTLSSSIAPVNTVALNCVNTSDDVTGIFASIGADGKLYLKNTTASKTHTIAGIWLTS